ENHFCSGRIVGHSCSLDCWHTWIARRCGGKPLRPSILRNRTWNYLCCLSRMIIANRCFRRGGRNRDIVGDISHAANCGGSYDNRKACGGRLPERTQVSQNGARG